MASHLLAISALTTLTLYSLPHSSHASTAPLTALCILPKTHILPPISITSTASFTAILYADGTIKLFDHRTTTLLCTHMHHIPGCTSVTISESETDVLLFGTSPRGVDVFSCNSSCVVATLAEGVSEGQVQVVEDLVVTGGGSMLFVFDLSSVKKRKVKSSSTGLSPNPKSGKKRKNELKSSSPPPMIILRVTPTITIPLTTTCACFTTLGNRVFMCTPEGGVKTFLIVKGEKGTIGVTKVNDVTCEGTPVAYCATHVNIREHRVCLSGGGETLCAFTPPLSLSVEDDGTSNYEVEGALTEMTLTLPNVIGVTRMGATRAGIVTERGGVIVYDVERRTTKPIVSTGTLDTVVLCCSASPGGDYLVCGLKDARVVIYDSSTLRIVKELKGHVETVTSVASCEKESKWKAGVEFVVSSSKDKTVKLWVGGKCVASVRGGEKDINEIAVSPNDSLICTAGADKTARLLNTTDLRQVALLKGHRRGVFTASFSSVDRVVATGAGDETVRIWSLADYTCVRTLQGHAGAVLRVAWCGGGGQIVTGGSDGMVKVWTVKSMESCTVDGHEDKVWGLVVMPDGRIVSGGGDKVNVWRDNSEELRLEGEKEKEENQLGEQELMNALRKQDWGAALEKAMGMDKPETVLKVVNDMRAAAKVLDLHVKGWEVERVSQMMRYCRQWNARALNCHVAQWVVESVVRVRSVEELAGLAEVVEYVKAMKVYSERHFERMEKVIVSSYEVDYVSETMGVWGGGELEGGGEEEGVGGILVEDGDVEGVVRREREREMVMEGKRRKARGEGVGGEEEGAESRRVEVIGWSSDEDDDLMDEDRD